MPSSAIQLAKGDPQLIAAIQRSRRLLGRKALVAAAASAVPIPGLDWAAAAALLSGALRVGAGAATGRDLAEVHLELGEVHYRAGDVPAAVADCRRAAELADALGDADLLAAAAVVVQGMGAPDVNADLLELTERALRAGPGQVQRSRVLAQRACALVQLDRRGQRQHGSRHPQE